MRPATEAAIVALTATIISGRIAARQRDNSLSVREWVELQRRLERAQTAAQTGRIPRQPSPFRHTT